MLKVLIIDDEKNIRESLKLLIKWENYGYTICSEAENSNEGISKFNTHKPDLIITDIRMPGMDGLDMIKQIKQDNGQVKILIITGYSYFQYAKQAIDYKVDGMILKPIDEDELVQKIGIIKREIEKEREDDELLKKSRGLSDERILSAIIQAEELEQKEKEQWLQDHNFPWKSYQLIIFKTEKPVLITHNQKEKIIEYIESGDLKKLLGYIFDLDGNLACLLEGKITALLIKTIEDIIGFTSQLMDCAITSYIGRVVKRWEEIGEVYRNIREVMDKSFFYRKSEIIFASIVALKNRKKSRTADSSVTDLTEQLFMAIDLNEEKAIESILEKIKQKFIDEKPEVDAVKGAYISLYHTIIKRITDKRKDMSYLLNDYEKLVLVIGKFERIHDINFLLREKLLKISFELYATRPRKDVVERAIEYIKRHYNTNIKLKFLAEMFHYNSAYFGQFFKKVTGHHFNTFLDKIRIEKAMDFLKEGQRVYMVAARTGFSDVDNFHKKFRKYTGMSPSEYRKNNTKQLQE